MPRPPLRARKKEETRTNIIACARDLFDKKGYEATTLEEIADAANVHKQTVLRYFATKEDIALVYRQIALEEFKSALLDPARKVSVIQCWRDHVVMTANRVAQRGDFFRYSELIHSDLKLFGASLRIEIMHEELIARALSEEAGVDPATDIYSRLVATTLIGGIRSIGRMIVENNLPNEDIVANTLAVVDFVIEKFPPRASAPKARKSLAAKAPARSGAAKAKPKPAKSKPKAKAR